MNDVRRRAACARQRNNPQGARSLLILGLGNVICGDDGLGVVAAERLRQGWELPAGVEVLDGGTLGLALLAHVTGADDLILLDAIQTGAPAGTLVRLAGDDVGPAVRERLSVHQIGVADLLDAMRLLDEVPRRLVLLGLVPETLELGIERSAAVASKLDDLVAAAAREAESLGYSPFVRGDLPCAGDLSRGAADATLPADREHRAHPVLGL